MMEKYLKETKMLDYSSKNIQRLIQERNWNDIEVFERLKSIYNFVRDEILFGYNIDDNISASKVLEDGYGVAVKNFKNPIIDFDRNNTYIQSEGINQDFGVYDSPDDLLKEHHQEMSVIKAFLYRNLGRHLMNWNVNKIRNS